jgi:hypothetical protein
VFDAFLGLEMVHDPAAGQRRPHIVPFSADGRLAWEAFTQAMANRTNALDGSDPFRGVLSKLRTYAVRFAALLWSLRRACDRGKMT